MKTTFILFVCLFASQLNAQQLNKEISENGQTPYLLGKIDKSGLEGTHYKSWFSKNHEDYQPNEALIKAISTELKSYDILLFMGTWCGDSKREVPKFYKVLEACDFPMEQLTVVAVGRTAPLYKQSPDHEEAGLNIHRVPTIIFYKKGKEVNRIVEHPVESFEKDIQNIITKNTYTSNYYIVTAINDILKTKGVEGLKRKEKKLIKVYGDKVSSMYELNTYGRVLFGNGKKEEAIEVFALNTKLFPDEPRTYMSLANTLGVSGQQEKAIEVLEEAIKIHPKNKDLQKSLEALKAN